MMSKNAVTAMKFFSSMGKKYLQKEVHKLMHQTDIEGNLSFFISSLHDGGVVALNQGKLDFEQNNTAYVFGGDFGDKGAASFTIGRMLADFQQAYPERVHLITGNRDLKATRFKEELDAATIRQRLLYGAPVHWNMTCPPHLYVQQAMKEQGFTGSETNFLASMSDLACQSLYLKWMLTATMGCGPIKPDGMTTFELYRKELSEQWGRTEETVADEEVTQYLLESIKAGGVYHDYLMRSKLLCRVGDTLFVHGAITETNLGYVPGKILRINEADEWIDSLNHWFHSQVLEWAQSSPLAPQIPPAQSELSKYFIFNPKSVATTNWYQDGKLAPLSNKVVTFLQKAGINRVITGHQPFADFPLVLRHPSGFEVVAADTSYSDPTAHDNRGLAYHSLVVKYKDQQQGEVNITAVRKTGIQQRINLTDESMKPLGTFKGRGEVVRLNEYGKWVGSTLSGFVISDTPLQEPPLPSISL